VHLINVGLAAFSTKALSFESYTSFHENDDEVLNVIETERENWSVQAAKGGGLGGGGLGGGGLGLGGGGGLGLGGGGGLGLGGGGLGLGGGGGLGLGGGGGGGFGGGGAVALNQYSTPVGGGCPVAKFKQIVFIVSVKYQQEPTALVPELARGRGGGGGDFGGGDGGAAHLPPSRAYSRVARHGEPS